MLPSLSALSAAQVDLKRLITYWRITKFHPKRRVSVFHDRIVTPHRWTGPNSLRMGSYNSDGKMDPETGLHRRYDPLLPHRLGKTHPVLLHPHEEFEQGIFGGPLLPAYGHFILESLARLWAAKDYPDCPVLFSVDDRTRTARLTPWMQEILGILDVSNPVALISQPVRVRKLLVPEPGYEIQYRFGRHHAAFLGRIAWRPVTGKKLWVSRAKLDGKVGACQSRAELETALVAEGWQIIHPETLPIIDQLEHFATAERIGGEQGSALHTMIFLQSAPGLRLDVFARDPTLSGHRINHNQATICSRRNVQYRLHRVEQEVVLNRSGAHVEKKYAPPDVYLALLNKF